MKLSSGGGGRITSFACSFKMYVESLARSHEACSVIGGIDGPHQLTGTCDGGLLRGQVTAPGAVLNENCKTMKLTKMKSARIPWPKSPQKTSVSRYDSGL